MTDNEERVSDIFARRMREFREARCWSQDELARRIGIGQSRLSVIEAEGSVTINQASEIAEVLGIPVEALIYANPPPTADILGMRLARITDAIERVRHELDELSNSVADSLRVKDPAR